jgi:hypothetical protein
MSWTRLPSWRRQAFSESWTVAHAQMVTDVGETGMIWTRLILVLGMLERFLRWASSSSVGLASVMGPAARNCLGMGMGS